MKYHLKLNIPIITIVLMINLLIKFSNCLHSAGALGNPYTNCGSWTSVRSTLVASTTAASMKEGEFYRCEFDRGFQGEKSALSLCFFNNIFMTRYERILRNPRVWVRLSSRLNNLHLNKPSVICFIPGFPGWWRTTTTTTLWADNPMTSLSPGENIFCLS